MVFKYIFFGFERFFFFWRFDFGNCIEFVFFEVVSWMVGSDLKEGNWELGRSLFRGCCGWSV